MFVVAVTFTIRSGSDSAFREIVLRQAHNSLTKEPACRQFDVCEHPDRPNQIFLYELYDDEAAFGVHRQTEHFAQFSQAAAPLIEDKVVSTWHLIQPT